jgi:hypothetical protein
MRRWPPLRRRQRHARNRFRSILDAKEGTHVATAYSSAPGDSERGARRFPWTEPLASSAPRDAGRLGRAILAEIPDLTSAAPASSAAYSSQIRFDPPQPRGDRASHRAAFDRPRLGDAPRSTQPSATSEIVARFAPAKSSVLPEGNPFAIPNARLHDRFKPLGQFVLLFVLFTAAGTSLLMIGRRQGAQPVVIPTATAIEASIGVPTAAADAADQVTTMFEPSAAPAPAGLDSGRTQTAVAQVGVTTAVGPASAPPAAPAEAAPAPYPSTNFPPVNLPQTVDKELPQVRAIDPPPAIARLRGEIRATSTR